MEKCLERFVERAEGKKHLYELTKMNSIALTAETTTGDFTIFFENKRVSLRPGLLDSAAVTLKGNIGVILALLDGKLKLREAVRRNFLDVRGNFRAILLAESFLYLNREDE
ncbi:SCP2 sterol-binding domain-containing protein [Mesobacillus zeae]|uniref:SCP2 domain-containing protein n=1 Tax=Mesobacillus zeae TaxID=1917180 RepID=A0A398B817_9BACI|nr:SCP2 sterol-binding domain-containing protein [Mesobacillus zeae]RID86259.1 hypothetical protein D1970_06950 [Mesobacillus zeae]